jgi:predicted permease
MNTSLRRLVALFRRNHLDDDLAEEIATHIELRRRALIAEGMDPRDAGQEARRVFGNVTAIREETRSMWGFPSLDTIAQDVRYALRQMRRSPAFSVTAILSLAVGIGASAAVFGLADTVFFRKLPVKNPDELVIFRWISGKWTAGSMMPFESLNGTGAETDAGNSSTSFSFPAFRAMQSEAARFMDIFGFADIYQVNVQAGGQSDLQTAQVVSGNYYEVLGVAMAAGRPIETGDDRADAEPAAVVSYEYARGRFGTAAAALGGALTVNAVPFTIVGVAPAGFRGILQIDNAPDVSLPMAMRERVVRDEEREDDPNFWWVLLAARLKPGTSTRETQPMLDAVLKQTIAHARPSLKPGDLPRLQLEPGARGQTETRDSMRESIVTMAGAVLLVLLVACANVANLLLARGRSRVREVAVRVAIGASRARVVRQLLTESFLLAALGSALGLGLSYWIAMALVPALTGYELAGTLAVTIGPRVAAFTVAVAGASTLLFGMVPALRASDAHLAHGLQEGSRGAAPGGSRARLAGVLVVVQVALSLVLVAGAGLLVGSVRNLQRIDVGFDPSRLLLFRIDPTLNGYEGPRLRQFYASALENLRALPGVVSATATGHTLLSNSASITTFVLPGTPAPSEQVSFRAGDRLTWKLPVDPAFFQTMGIRIQRGRGVLPTDTVAAPRVAVINERLASRAFPGKDAIGQRFSLSERPGAVVYEVVGVSSDAKYSNVRSDVPSTVYVPYMQEDVGAMTFELKASGDPLHLVAAARDVVRRLDPNLPLFGVRTQEDQIRRALRQERLFAGLATMLGGVTLLLAGVGLYGLLAYTVTRRTQEIGVRMALGAARTSIRWMVLRQALILALVGLAGGIPAAVFGTRVLQSLLYGLAPADPVTLSGAAALLLALSVLAAWLPARRASRVDPIVALRIE